MIIAQVIDSDSGQFWCRFLNVKFKVLSLREETIIVKCCFDEGYATPYDVHEFPKSAVKLFLVEMINQLEYKIISELV